MQAFFARAEVSCMLQASLAEGWSHFEECQIGNRKKGLLFLSVTNSELNSNHVTFFKAYKCASILEEGIILTPMGQKCFLTLSLHTDFTDLVPRVGVHVKLNPILSHF